VRGRALGLRGVQAGGRRSGRAGLFDALASRAEADLARLGVTLPAPLPLDGALYPVAADYVLLGARMGSRVIKARWRRATDPAICAASLYFDAPDGLMEWRSFCGWAEARPANGSAADRAVAHARRVFDYFARYAAHSAPQKEVLDVGT